jgi:Bacterial PH domain
MEGMTYRASADPFVLWLTLFVSVILVGVAVGAVWFAVVSSLSGLRIGAVVVALFCGGLLALSYLYSPRSYRLSGSAIVIERPLRNVEIPIASVHKVETVNVSSRNTIRVFGVGGLFGVYGRFRHSDLGPFTMYGSRMGSAVLLDTDSGPVVITPDDGEAFTQALDARLATG